MNEESSRGAGEHDLGRAVASRRIADDLFAVDVPDGWQQGRGAFGGLTVGILITAIEGFAAATDRSLRSLTVELPAALMPGAAEVRVETLRAGAGQSTLAARLIQSGEVRGFAVAVLAKPRAPGSEEFCELAAPELRDWRAMDPMDLGAIGPVFSKHFEYRSDGPFPFVGGPEALAQGWVRARSVGDVSKTAWLALMADTWWPSTFTRATAPFAMGTVAYTLQIVGDAAAVDTTVPLRYRARAWVQSQGWFVEQRELWDEAGKLLALNQQTFAIIK